MNRVPKDSMVIGFCDFCSHQEAKSALVQLQNEDWGAGLLKVTFNDSNRKSINSPTIEDPFTGARTPSLSQTMGHTSKSIHSSSSCLYVGDLNPHTTEEDLRNVFSQFGTIVSVKILTTRANGKSFGDSYINFEAHDDAFKAEESCNLLEINGQPCHLMFAESNSNHQNNFGKLFIRGLHPNIDSKRVEELFCPFGTIVTGRLKTDGEGNSEGYAYVQFDTHEHAVKAVEAMNGKEVGSIEEPEETCPISVCHFHPISHGFRFTDSIRTQTNVLVKNLPIEVTDEAF
ncbi:hypothetical protein GEMRC1_001764 [Eukaryota sp. GEM-RC1]